MINKYLAELMGTFVLVGLGSMGILAADAVGETGAAKLILVAFAFGLALLAGIWAVGHVSGAHFNPAVTLAMLLDKRIALGDAIGYWVAQFAGGILGSLIILAVSGSRVAVFATGTYYDNYTTGLVSEIMLTAVFVWVILAVVRRGGNHAPAAIALSLVGVHMAGIPFSGASVNPARSFGPAIVSGFDPDIWLYLYAPLVGAIVAFALYRLFAVEDVPAV
ncbi:MAG TPA: aquaporin [Acidimicrobiia bacterium]|nr:aquaporin [Acidimicrobiia bacterium]